MNGGGQLHPVTVFELFQSLALAHQRQELHVVFAADHGKAAGAMDALELPGVAHQRLEGNGDALVAVRVVHQVHIPHAVLVVGQVQMAAAQIEGGHVGGHILLAGTVGILQIDVGTAVDHLQIAAAQLLPQLRVAAVEDQQVGVGDLLHHQLAHVADVHLKGVGIHQHHDLIQDPIGRQARAVQRLQLPHAVILHNDLLGLVLLFQLLEQGRGHLLRVVDGIGEHVVQRLGVVLVLAFLAADQQRAVLSGKAVPQDAVDKVGLTGIQKTGNKVNRNIHTACSPYRPNSSWSLCSSRLAPITHRRPV